MAMGHVSVSGRTSLLQLCDVSCETIQLFQSHCTAPLFRTSPQPHKVAVHLPAALLYQLLPLTIVMCCVTRPSRFIYLDRIVHSLQLLTRRSPCTSMQCSQQIGQWRGRWR